MAQREFSMFDRDLDGKVGAETVFSRNSLGYKFSSKYMAATLGSPCRSSIRLPFTRINVRPFLVKLTAPSATTGAPRMRLWLGKLLTRDLTKLLAVAPRLPGWRQRQ